ncbi:MAG: NAD(P)-binding protein [Cyclobacteriaceae bacterium]|nr:NAD(P)-binding protein [Cyclobacteriaceae bacterium]
MTASTHQRIAVIGAGISGVSAGRMLTEKGHEVVIYEKEEKPGGLIRCDRIDGNLFHKVGGHVFNAKNKEVSDWFWKHFDRNKEFIKAERNAKILLNGKMIGYPLENHLYQLEEDTVAQITRELLELQAKGYKDPFSYANFEDFLQGNFGEALYNLYFKPYNEKIWKVDLSTVPMPWLEGKLPMPDYNKIFLNNITRSGEKEMVHSTFYYPKQGGSQFIIDRLAEGLTIKSNTPVEELKCLEGQWYVNGEGPYDKIIYTGDIRQLPNTLQLPSTKQLNTSTAKLFLNPLNLLNSPNSLRSNSTSNLLCYTDTTDLSWLYLPEADLQAHRIIYTGNFSETNNAPGGRKTCVVEFSGKVSLDIMKKEIKKLPGNLEAISSNYGASSYVIQNSDTRSIIENLKKGLKPLNFHISGRFAEWEYYNMDAAMEVTMKTLNNNFV